MITDTKELKELFKSHVFNGKTIQIDDTSEALAYLLDNDFISACHPDSTTGLVQLAVNCSDVFAWGCSDAEPIVLTELPDLIKEISDDYDWGSTIWCMKKRKQQPQTPVKKDMIQSGTWKPEFNDLGEPYE